MRFEVTIRKWCALVVTQELEEEEKPQVVVAITDDQ